MVQLGDWVQDDVTEFAGYVTAREERLGGGTRCEVTKNAYGGLCVKWFEEARLEVLRPLAFQEGQRKRKEREAENGAAQT